MAINIVILGSGAIGLLWYSKLKLCYKQANISVRGSKPVSKNNTHVQLTDSKQQQFQIPLVYADDKQIMQADVILCCVKSYQVAEALGAIKTLISSNAEIILCHNGMGSFEQVSPMFPANTLLTLLTTHGALREKPFSVIHTGKGLSQLGVLSAKSCYKIQLLNMLNKALPKVEWHNNIKQAQWQKLAINAVINPLTAIYNINNGELLAPQYQAQIEQLCQEIVTIAQLDGIHFQLSELKNAILDVAKKTSINCSSMRTDVLHHRMTEIDFINGYLYKLAAQNQVSAPLNKALVSQVKALN